MLAINYSKAREKFRACCDQAHGKAGPMSIRFITEAAAIAAVYAVLTLCFAPISSGQFQVRIAEALTVLPFFTAAAIPGLYIGCLIANIFAGQGFSDMVIGPFATLLAAFLTAKMPNKYLAPLPPVLINAIYVGILLFYIAELPMAPTMLFVAIGELIACYGLGFPLMLLIIKHEKRILGHRWQNVER